MTRLRLRKPGEWTAVAAAIIMLFSPLAQSTASATPWRISLDGADVTGLAVPFSGSREPLVNVAALGSTLGLSVQASDNVMLCTNGPATSGERTTAAFPWSASAGASRSQAPPSSRAHRAICQSGPSPSLAVWVCNWMHRPGAPPSKRLDLPPRKLMNHPARRLQITTKRPTPDERLTSLNGRLS